jgi:hypothetical protein
MKTRNFPAPAAVLLTGLLLAPPAWAGRDVPAPKQTSRARPNAELATPPQATPAKATPAPSAPSKTTDEDMSLRGGQEGTAFRSLTIEGEDRIRLDFERPALQLDLDPERAPGLDLGGARDVLDRSVPDLATPLLALSAEQRTPYLARPWLAEFASGAVARFRPEVKNVERWRLVIANSKGQTVATFEGRGEPPREIAWDGRSQGGASVVPGLTYSYVLEAFDKAGNKRNFVGQGFTVSAYRLESSEGLTLVFSGGGLLATPNSVGTPPLLLEAASWLNQSARAKRSITVTATGRSFEQANALAYQVGSQLASLALGDPATIRTTTQVEPDAPEGGYVKVTSAPQAPTPR